MRERVEPFSRTIRSEFPELDIFTTSGDWPDSYCVIQRKNEAKKVSHSIYLLLSDLLQPSIHFPFTHTPESRILPTSARIDRRQLQLVHRAYTTICHRVVVFVVIFHLDFVAQKKKKADSFEEEAIEPQKREPHTRDDLKILERSHALHFFPSWSYAVVVVFYEKLINLLASLHLKSVFVVRPRPALSAL